MLKLRVSFPWLPFRSLKFSCQAQIPSFLRVWPPTWDLTISACSFALIEAEAVLSRLAVRSQCAGNLPVGNRILGLANRLLGAQACNLSSAHEAAKTASHVLLWTINPNPLAILAQGWPLQSKGRGCAASCDHWLPLTSVLLTFLSSPALFPGGAVLVWIERSSLSQAF